MPFDSEHGGEGKSLLVIGGAGGVGSIAIQLARRAGFTVIAPASRTETTEWCRTMGALHGINQRPPPDPQLEAPRTGPVDAVRHLAAPDHHCHAQGPQPAPT